MRDDALRGQEANGRIDSEKYVDEFSPSPDPDPEQMSRFLEIFRCARLADSWVRFGAIELYYAGSGSGELNPVWDVHVAGESIPRGGVNPAAFRTAREFWDHLCALADELPKEQERASE